MKSNPPKIREIITEMDITTIDSSNKVSFLGQEIFLNSALTSRKKLTIAFMGIL